MGTVIAIISGAASLIVAVTGLVQALRARADLAPVKRAVDEHLPPATADE